jgi:hypothetical protein
MSKFALQPILLLALAAAAIPVTAVRAEDSQRAKDLAVMIVGEDHLADYYDKGTPLKLERREAPILVAILRADESEKAAAVIRSVVSTVAPQLRDGTTAAMPKFAMTDDFREANLIFALGRGADQLKSDNRWSKVMAELGVVHDALRAALKEAGIADSGILSNCINYNEVDDGDRITRSLVLVDPKQPLENIGGCALAKYLEGVGIGGHPPQTASMLNSDSPQLYPSPFDWQTLRVLYGPKAQAGAALMTEIRREVAH